MVQKVTGFKAQDGKVFNTEAEAVAHEKVLLLGVAVGAAIAALGFENAVLVKDGGESGVTDLKTFLLSNSEVLVDALTPPKKERKPRTPKEPVKENLGAGAGVAAALAEEAKEAPVEVKLEVLGSDDSAEDELAALLGAEVQV